MFSKTNIVEGSVKYLSIFVGATASALMFAAAPSMAQQQAPQEGEQPTMPQQQQADIDVSQEELERFAKAFDSVQDIQKQAREEMTNIIEQQNLSIEEYNQLFRQQQQGAEAGEEMDVSQDKLERFKAADSKIDELEKQAQSDIEDAISNQGLEVDRFEEILMGVQQDPELQQKVQEILQN